MTATWAIPCAWCGKRLSDCECDPADRLVRVSQAVQAELLGLFQDLRPNTSDATLFCKSF